MPMNLQIGNRVDREWRRVLWVRNKVDREERRGLQVRNKVEREERRNCYPWMDCLVSDG